MVNKYMAGEETLSTFDPFLQALFTEANMIGFSMNAHQSGIVNGVGDEEKERPAFKLIPCSRCGTHSKTGHENGELCAVEQNVTRPGRNSSLNNLSLRLQLGSASTCSTGSSFTVRVTLVITTARTGRRRLTRHVQCAVRKNRM